MLPKPGVSINVFAPANLEDRWLFHGVFPAPMRKHPFGRGTGALRQVASEWIKSDESIIFS